MPETQAEWRDHLGKIFLKFRCLNVRRGSHEGEFIKNYHITPR